MIPRSDFQYSWVTASTDRFDAALGAANNVYGYFPYDGLARVSSSVDLDMSQLLTLQALVKQALVIHQEAKPPLDKLDFKQVPK